MSMGIRAFVQYPSHIEENLTMLVVVDEYSEVLAGAMDALSNREPCAARAELLRSMRDHLRDVLDIRMDLLIAPTKDPQRHRPPFVRRRQSALDIAREADKRAALKIGRDAGVFK